MVKYLELTSWKLLINVHTFILACPEELESSTFILCPRVRVCLCACVRVCVCMCVSVCVLMGVGVNKGFLTQDYKIWRNPLTRLAPVGPAKDKHPLLAQAGQSRGLPDVVHRLNKPIIEHHR